jgi:Arc/MetJ-type ribon-helix-helix transcriptional regulator
MTEQTVSLNPQDMIDWEGFRQSRFAADAKGHSARMSFRIQPQIVRVMSELVKEFDEEYKEPADLIRHAIREHIRRLQTYREFKEEDRIMSTMAQVDAMLHILEMEEHQADFDLTIHRAHEIITKMYAQGAHGEVARLLGDLKKQVSQMSSEFWKEKYLQEFKARFGHLVKNVEGMTLDPSK